MGKFLSMTVRRQMILLIVLMTVMSLGIIFFTEAKQHSRDVQEASLLVERLANEVSNDQKVLLAGAEQLLSTLAHVQSVQRRSAAAVNTLFTELIKKNPQISNILMIDSAGLVWASGLQLPGRITAADRRFFKNAMATGKFSSGEYTVGRVLSKPAISFGYPFRDSSGEIRDVATAAFTLDKYSQLLKMKNLPAATSLVLTDHKGTILFDAAAPQFIGKQDKEVVFRRMTEGPDRGTFTAIGITGIQRQFSYQKLRLNSEQTPYMYVRAGIPTSVAFKKTVAGLGSRIGLLAVVMLLTLGLAAYMSKRGILDKIVALRDASRLIAQGNLDVRVSDHVQGGELGELGQAFDEMTRRLAEDLERRRQDELKLRQYADIVFRMQTGLFVYRLDDKNDDRSLRLMNSNPASTALVGLQTVEVIGKRIDDIFPRLREQGIPGKFADVVRNGIPFEVEEFNYGDANRPASCFSFKVFPLPDDCVGVLFENIIERKQAEEALTLKQRQLEILNRSLETRIITAVAEMRQKDDMLIQQGRLAAMGEMINNIAHQWRQPLNNLGLIVQNMQLSHETGELSTEQMEKDVAAAMRVILYMSSTIDDFRNYFRYEKEPSDFIVNQTVSRALNFVSPALKSSGINVELDEQPDISAKGYPNEYLQALLNILNNAKDVLLELKAADPLISIRICRENNRSVVIIRDNGGGISEAVLPKIFDPYFTTKDQGKGTGLGLYMSKAIIEKNMGGRISVCNVDGGVEFRIEI